MNKQEYLNALRDALEKQSISNIDNMIEYYDEMICDRMEDGMSEEDAVNSMDSITDIVHEAVLDKSVPTLVKEKVKKSRDKAKSEGKEWIWILLAVLGFPVWFPLVFTFAILLFVFFLVFWILVGTLFIIVLALGISAVACFLTSFTVLFGYISFPGFVVSLGGALALAGITILLWKPIVAFAKVAAGFFKDIIISIKKKFI
ncbi:MAG: DUF1700 domain-containing protein [Lachnospiraceae bacterium]|nr:DUF1700 domain-containing protein [Lachnospiraceae bacterium]